MTPSLARLLGDLVAAAPGITAETAGDITTWFRAGRAFAAGGPSGAEFRLDPAIAAAAARTPDAGPSARGREWVRFNPRTLDGHAADRVTAWFELACRRAGGSPG